MPGRLLYQETHAAVPMDAASEPQTGSAGPSTNGVTKVTKGNNLNNSSKDESGLNGHTSKSTVDHPQDLVTKMKELPPELQQVTEGYAPLSRLFERVAQDSHNTLQDILSGLEITQEHDTSQANGNSAPLNRPSGLSDQKRVKLLEWAKSTRDRFMKLFVMLQWAQNSRDPVGKLIDLRDCMLKGVFADQAVHENLMWIAKNTQAMRVQNPDLDNALRFLLGGDCSRMSDLDYLPKKPLSAKEILAEFDRINVLLHIRLNLHENLPKHLQNFIIASGRVTFRSPGSFEMDVSILDEDPTSRFYFIDFRFLFSPSSEIPTGQLRYEVEFRLNTILASNGLIACFDFLHDFVLTYKLSVLRRQAEELARRSWNGHLGVTQIGRSLILHYWTQRPAKKSWLEIGVHSGRKDGVQVERPRLNVKWMRHGKAIADCLQLDEEDLDVEFFLNTVIQEHIHGLLEAAAKKLSSIMPMVVNSAMRLEQEADGDNCLLLPLYTKKEVQIRAGAITGAFAATPMDATMAKIVEDLDGQRDPVDEMVQILLDARIQDAKSGVTRGLESRNWHIVNYKNLDAATRRNTFGDPKASPLFARRWQNPNWVLAACPDGCFGIDFWLIELKPYPSASKEVDGFQMRSSQRLGFGGKVFSQAWLTNIQETASFTISSFTIARQLQALGLAFTTTGKSFKIQRFPRARKQLKHTISSDFTLTQRNIAVPSSRFGSKVSALNNSSGQVAHVATFKMLDLSQMPTLRLMFASRSSDMSISPSGEISILVKSPIGSTFPVDHVLRSIDELSRASNDFSGTLAEMRIREVSTERMVFDYGQTSEPMTAVVDFPFHGKTSISFRPHKNPHRRIQQFLETALRTSTSVMQCSNLGSLPESLSVSLPLLHTFDVIESRKDAPEIHALDPGCYNIVYRRPVCRVQVQFAPQNKQAYWNLQYEQLRRSVRTRNSGAAATVVANEPLQLAMKEMYSMSGTDDIRRSPKRIFVRPSAIKDLLLRMDELIRHHANDEPELPPPSKIESRPQEMQPLKPQPVQTHPHHLPPQIPQQQPQQSNEHRHTQQHQAAPNRPLPNASQRTTPQSQPMTQSRSQGQIPQFNQPQPTYQPMTHSRSQGQHPSHLQPQPQAPGSRPLSRSGTNTPIPNANARGPQFPQQLPHQMQGQGQAGPQLPQGTNSNGMVQGQQMPNPQVPDPQNQRPILMMHGLDYTRVPEKWRHWHPNDFTPVQQRTFFGPFDQNLGVVRKRKYDDLGNYTTDAPEYVSRDAPRKAPRTNGANGANGAAGSRQYQSQHQQQNQYQSQNRNRNQSQNQNQDRDRKGKGGKGEKIIIDLDD